MKFFQEEVRQALKDDMVSRMEEWESKEKLMNNGTISSQRRQYARKALEDHLPCTMTIKWSTPSSKR